MLKQIAPPNLKLLEPSQSDTPNPVSVLGLAPPEYASRKAKQLFGCYRKADANDGEIYAAGVAAILSEYPPEIIDYVCDPRTGLPRRLKWLPTMAEIAEACDARVDYARAVASLRKMAAARRAIISDPKAADAAKEAAQAWLDSCKSLKDIGV